MDIYSPNQLLSYDIIAPVNIVSISHPDKIKEQHKHAVTLRAMNCGNVNHLRIIRTDYVKTALQKFVGNVLYYSKTKRVYAIYIQRCNLSDRDVCDYHMIH